MVLDAGGQAAAQVRFGAGRRGTEPARAAGWPSRPRGTDTRRAVLVGAPPRTRTGSAGGRDWADAGRFSDPPGCAHPRRTSTARPAFPPTWVRHRTQPPHIRTIASNHPKGDRCGEARVRDIPGRTCQNSFCRDTGVVWVFVREFCEPVGSCPRRGHRAAPLERRGQLTAARGPAAVGSHRPRQDGDRRRRWPPRRGGDRDLTEAGQLTVQPGRRGLVHRWSGSPLVCCPGWAPVAPLGAATALR